MQRVRATHVMSRSSQKLLFAMSLEVSRHHLPIMAAHGVFGVAMQRQ